MKSFWVGLAFSASFICAPVMAAEAPTGDLHLSYLFAPLGEQMPYRVYVPPEYNGKTAMPLVVILHGAGETEDGIFDRRGGAELKQLADKHGFILLAPRGYSANGGFGDIYPVVVTRQTALDGVEMGKRAAAATASRAKDQPPPRPPGPRQPLPDVAVPAEDHVDQPKGELSDTRSNVLSEQDVIASIEQVRNAYKIDASRIYLMGNSMGGVGAAYLAVKYPQMWAAVSPSGGPVAAWSYPFERLRDNKLPLLFVHGEFDEHANPHWSAVLAADGKAEGADTELLIVKGGHHGDAWIMALPQIFDFFDHHTRQN
jgi:poly(3-hydroxybutyrate) depolymerase